MPFPVMTGNWPVLGLLVWCDLQWTWLCRCLKPTHRCKYAVCRSTNVASGHQVGAARQQSARCPAVHTRLGGGEGRHTKLVKWRGKHDHWKGGWMLETRRFADFIDQAWSCIDRPRIPHAPRHDKSLACYSRCRFCTQTRGEEVFR